MSIDPVKIPQNVQIEDRIVGPLTLRQIIIMGLGGGFSYAMYASVQKAMGSVSIPLTVLLWLPAAIAAMFALVRINDLSLVRICFLFMEKMSTPSVRTWAPRQGISITFKTANAKAKEIAAQTPLPKSDTQSIQQLSSTVDNAVLSTPPSQSEDVTPPIKDMDAKEVISDVADLDMPKVKRPVNPDRIKVDQSTTETTPQLSDLSIFRDIFPPQTQWH